MLRKEAVQLKSIGKIVNVNNHKLHVYSEGLKNNKPTLVLMSGGGTAAPTYDFKPLYKKLSDEYHIVVVEKAGYGYSDIVAYPRDVDTLLEETRQALILSGETAPYVLLPHSMSGLEALYWAQKYPNEIEAIIGLDMATPQFYQKFKIPLAGFYILKAMCWLGIHRLPFIKIINKDQLSKEEYKQAKYLAYRNLFNISHILEGKAIHENAKKVEEFSLLNTKFLLFCSNGKETGALWLSYQQELSEQTSGELICLDCGHYIHYYESTSIAEKTKEFLKTPR